MIAQLIYNGAYFIGILTVTQSGKAILKYFNSRTNKEMVEVNDFKLEKDKDNCIHWAGLHCSENDWTLWEF